MDLTFFKNSLQDLKSRYDIIYKSSKIEDNKIRLNELEKITSESNFYSFSNSKEIFNEIKSIKDMIDNLELLYKNINEIETYIEILEENFDLEMYKENESLIILTTKLCDNIEINTLLSDEYDNHNCIISIHPGAGGTESMDWADMLYKMYCKWCNNNNYTVEVLDLQLGDIAGIKSISFLVKGKNSYGYLKGEKGVHRLVRISPFDSNSRRHTSFASVEVMPEITDNIEINILPEDIEIDTYRASGAGGQHVNKTDSAIRIRHLSSGIVVTCQNERSQLQNKENALKVLKSRLYEYNLNKNKEKMLNIKGEVSDNAWGSQIRSYVFCPYTLVKDHRTNTENGNVQSVMNGNIDKFIYEYLKFLKNN
ncbi:MAG: peptide chain release factor 2 [Clostridia bacterium]